MTAARYYSFAGQMVAVRNGKGLRSVSSIICDVHGTPTAVVPNTNWTPGSVQRVHTDPFGGVRGSGSTAPGDRQFLGATRDASGLTMLNARYYDESIGQFISVDPVLDPGLPAQFNAYVYSGNNPLTWSDPSGLSWLDDVLKKAGNVGKAIGRWVDKNQAEISGAVAGVLVTGGCLLAAAGAGSIGCAIAGGAAAGAVTNLWKTQVQKTEEFSWGGLLADHRDRWRR